MEPVTTAVIGAASAGLAAGATDIGKKAVVDAYSGFKKLITDKFGSDSELVDAVEKVEKNPDSKGRQMTLEEEVANAGADKDGEVVKAAQELISMIIPQQTPQSQFIMDAKNSRGAIQSGNISHVTQNYGKE